MNLLITRLDDPDRSDRLDTGSEPVLLRMDVPAGSVNSGSIPAALAVAFAHLPQCAWLVDAVNHWFPLNRAAVRLAGDLALHSYRPCLHKPLALSADACGICGAIAARRPLRNLLIEVPAGDRQRRFSLSVTPIPPAGESGVLVIVDEIFQASSLEEEPAGRAGLAAIRQAAHEFNNLFTVIFARLELMRGRLGKDHPAGSHLDQIETAATRAAVLNSQVQGLTRPERGPSADLEEGEALERVIRIDRSPPGAEIDDPSGAGGTGRRMIVDPDLFERMILSLMRRVRSVNGDDSRLSLRAEQALDGDGGRHLLLLAGCGGTGAGQEPVEPLTGRAPGTGVDLLSLNAELIRLAGDAGGTEMADQTPGEEIFLGVMLPNRQAAPLSAGSKAPETAESRARQTILVVEDEEMVRELAVNLLCGAGYSVLQASSGDEALALVLSHYGKIDLVVTDATMPGLQGRELVQRVREICPEMPVLIMSGYTDDEVLRGSLQRSDIAWVEKPFRPADLLGRIKDQLTVRAVDGAMND